MAHGPESKILIVGAGCFGLSTGYHLLKRGFKNVTIIDRSETLPAPDAASTDVNKVVRSSYADEFYTKLARDAIRQWKDESEWGENYHESGVIVLGSDSDTYVAKSYINDISIGCRIEKLDSAENVRSEFPADIKLGQIVEERLTRYLNRDGGWVHAAGGIIQGMKNVTALGGEIIGGKEVKKLTKTDGKTSGLECADGSTFTADLIVIATGSWTPSAFPDLHIDEKCTATGHGIAMIQLTPEEADRYRQVPIFLDQETGFYIFPPNSDNIVKLAIHSPGYTRKAISSSNISTPRTVLSHGEQEGLRIPKSKAKDLRNYLRGYYPELAEKPFFKTRLCWYSDTEDEDWVIGFHPKDPSIVVASGGSGHAYKFFPVIGRLVADVIQGTLPNNLVAKFALDRPSNKTTVPEARQNKVPELDEDQLCTPEDLLP